MEKNVLEPKVQKGEVKSLFEVQLKKLIKTYYIKDYLLVTDSYDAPCLIRGSPEKLSSLLIKGLQGNAKVRKVIVWFLRDSGIIKLFESEVKKND